MTERELFEEVLNKIAEREHLRIEKPYSNCQYLELYSGDKLLGGFNPDGYSLLFNIGKLYHVCRTILGVTFI